MSRHDEELDRYLSGQRSLGELPDPLRREEERLQELLEAVRHRPEVPPGLYEAVMSEVRATSEPLWKRAMAWLFRPRTVRLRPATAGLALMVLLSVVVLIPRNGSREDAASPVEQDVVTRFVFVAPGASSVRITGDFVDWDPDGLSLTEERGTGIWTLDLTLEPGVYQYGFVVDGEEWRPDPRAVSNVDDGFGRENSVVIVSEPSST